jgi:PKD repeat protein
MNKKVIIIGSVGLVIILIIVILSVSLVSYSIFSKENEFRNLEFTIDNQDVRELDSFNITISNLPGGANVSWDFGDGNISYNQIGSHEYELPGYYTIFVEATWDGGSGNGTFEIGIKNRDYHRHDVNDALLSLRRGRGTGNSDSHYFAPGISNPSFNIEIILKDAIGAIEYFVEVFTYYEDDANWDTVFSESRIATYETISFEKEISQIQVDPNCIEVEVWAGFILWEGRVRENEITMELTF